MISTIAGRLKYLKLKLIQPNVKEDVDLNDND